MILVTGSSGLVGHAIKFYNSQNNSKFFYADRNDANLINLDSTRDLFKRINPTKVIHLAGMVGGVKANLSRLADFFLHNIRINLNVLQVCAERRIHKTASLMSTCIYPDKVSYPITEDQLHDGGPHESNYGYAYAKRMLDIQSKTYRDQYGLDFITLVPNNIYGPYDNFDLENGHAIPSIIHKIWKAKKDNTEVKLWGDGSQLRQFTYSVDIANCILWALDNYNEREPINIGNDEEISIKEIAEMIADNLDFSGKIIWEGQNSGQFKKTVSFQKLRDRGYTKEFTNIKNGIYSTCKWFKYNLKSNVRGYNE